MSKEDQGRRLRPMADTALLSYLYEVIQDAIAETEDNELTSLALDRKLQRAKGMLEKELDLDDTE